MAEETGLNLTSTEPPKTGFLASRPKCYQQTAPVDKGVNALCMFHSAVTIARNAMRTWNNKIEEDKKHNSTKHDLEMPQWQIIHSMKPECKKLLWFNTCDIFVNYKLFYVEKFTRLLCLLNFLKNLNEKIIMKNLSSYTNYMSYVNKLSLMLATWPRGYKLEVAYHCALLMLRLYSSLITSMPGLEV